MSGYITLFCTVPDKKSAEDISYTLVSEKLAACVNIIDGVDSIYFWEGKVQDDSELLLVIKTKKSLYEKLEKKIKSIHPYKVPEIIAFEIFRGSVEYLNWIDESVE
ncbi:divalent-cation tolerance protein CutA [Nitrosophilus alvini]|uniref:divalent-cation tolerance protein CutA n=1 Tax=Nitrosophilus alvini TaxID=2714855 RepID=UPI00190DB096|nr:divalent-cation tolerance protein CutA [Nitrosophilus alvini]